ncbi:MAG: hypothetical protein ABR607_00240 [Pyrinomonadaceae bacterium]
MKFFDPNNPNEKKKMIAAGALGLIAILVLGYVFFGGSSKPSNKTIAHGPSPTPRMGATPVQPQIDEELSIYQPINYPVPVPPVSEANRNVFAFYIPPSPTPKPVYVAPATPTPTPPVTASSLSPSNVYATTPGDFTLQLNGDRFTPALHIVLDGRDLPTRFISPQQLFATVSATLISSPGVRQVMARSNDGQLYSNTIALNVSPPPLPNYNYVGLIGKPHFNDTAVLQDKGNKDLLNVQRGDAVGGRFRVVSISEKEVRLIDTALKITTRIPFTTDPNSTGPYRPPTRTVDDEP